MKFADHTSVANTPRLLGALRAAIAAFQPINVLETGTYLGTGTTQAILDSLGNCCVTSFITIECNPVFSAEAKDRLNIKGVSVITGLSVPLNDAVVNALADPFLANPPEGVARDHIDPARYKDEITLSQLLNKNSDGWLEKLLPRPRPLICLDSCGALGLLEFNLVCHRQPAPFLLFLDDVNHVKHYRSRLQIAAVPRGWKVHDEADGWLIAEALA